ncbi:S53 family peptidase [Actinacidiphila yeochonensis]|uniref:S53 family peptidase n=1 Tax=Actinacidiphila yeochonensis TaxID=89050 RepID=UPI00068E37FC|nr:S53 family peptidase [Actinacidiphila yeochonensis]
MSRSLRRRLPLAALAAAATAALLSAGPVMATPGTSSDATTASATPSSATGTAPVDACDLPKPGFARCLAQFTPGAPVQRLRAATPQGTTAALPQGYGPADLQSAYNLGSAVAAGAGDGTTVAIVDGYDDPTAEADLAVYRSTYGLPACTTGNGCFTKVGQDGSASLPVTDGGWAVEISLDLQAVSAACPGCHILLVEANTPALPDLAAAEDTAVRLGAAAVSNSYSVAEGTNVAPYAGSYDHPGVAITVSSGDYGYQLAAPFPASLPTVTAVGGTSLTRAPGTARGWSETAWALDEKGSAAGSACSAYYDKPAWQHDTACPGRTVADVSADADPATGLAVYDSTPNPDGIPAGWFVVGGTSASSPFVAGVYALAGNTAQVKDASYAYAHRSHLYDVQGGNVSNPDAGSGCPDSSYVCTALPGYDGPTGLGTPNGTGAF